MTRQLDQKKAEMLVRQAQGYKSQGELSLTDSVLVVSIKANRSLFDMVKEGAEMSEELRQVLSELLEDEINKREARGEARGLKALIDTLKNLNLDLDSAYKSIIKTEVYSNVSREQVMEYWQ